MSADQGLTVNKICVDSRFRLNKTSSDTDFSVELPETIYLPVGTRCFVTDFSMVHAWYTVEQYVNDKIFFTYNDTSNRHKVDAILTLPAMNYNLETLTNTIQQLFNDLKEQYPTELVLFEPTVTMEESTGSFAITTRSNDPGNFYIWTDAKLLDKEWQSTWVGGWYDGSYPGSANRLFKNFTQQTCNKDRAFVSGFVDCLTNHNIYVKSSQLGTFQNIGPQGERDILKKILVDVPFGELITEKWISTDFDYTDCSRLTLKTLYFRVTDVNNIPLNLHGHHVSFSLVFAISGLFFFEIK